MLSIDFETLNRSHPEHGSALGALADWVRAHPTANFIVPTFVARDLFSVDVNELNDVFDLLISTSHFVQVYRVLDPTIRTFLPGQWESPLKVPERLLGRYQQMVDASEATVVPVLVPRE